VQIAAVFVSLSIRSMPVGLQALEIELLSPMGMDCDRDVFTTGFHRPVEDRSLGL
jgi:hypothetical protein